MTVARRLAPAAALLALAACATAHRKVPEGVTRVQLALARELVDQHRYDAAVVAIQRIHETSGRSPESLTLRAMAYRGQGLRQEALVDLDEALWRDRDHAPAHAVLAVLHDEARRFAKGEEHHRLAVELDPENASYVNDWGYALYQQGKIQEALARYQQAVRLDPLPARYHNNLGFAYARAGDFTRAAQHFEVAGSPGVASNNLGYAYELAGNLPRAFDAYAEAVRLAPGLTRARANLEEVARRLGREVPADLGPPVKVSSGGKTP